MQNGLQKGYASAGAGAAVHSLRSGDAPADGDLQGAAAAEQLNDPHPQLSAHGSLSLHYDPATDVVLRYDVLSSRAVKVLIALVWLVILLGVALLVGAVYLQESEDSSWFFTHNALPITNLACASLCTAALLGYGLFFLHRVLRVNASGKRWSHRRRRLATLAGAELALQLFSALFFLAPNAYLLTDECGWFSSLIAWSAFVRWTCWNSTFCLYLVEAHSSHPAQGRWRVERPGERGAPFVGDAPLWRHWKKALYWCLVEGNYAALSAVVETKVGRQQVPPPPACHTTPYDCNASGAIIALASTQFSLNLGYFLIYAFLISRSFYHLLRLPYEQNRQANFVVRLQLRLRGLILLFFALSVCLYTFVGAGSCRSYLLTWLGLLPVQLVTGLVAIINCFVMTPTRPDHAAILQEWLQEFAWTEAEVPRRRRRRASSLPPESKKAVAINREPMFCVETALKLAFWSFVCYDHMEVPGSIYALEAAMQMYRLQHSELLWERANDVKCIVAWSDDTVVVAFRGTASLANVKADLQVWRARWPSGVGRPLLGTAPMIHWGFHRSWTAAGFDQRLLSMVKGIVDKAPAKPVKVLVTGHSLGGALATLCAQELATQLAGAVQVQVYCFGAPRTGNHAHARMYNKAVRQTWHVVNNEDVVVKNGKFIVLYKRAGHRVLINSLGDLVVRPTHAETVIRTLPGANSIRDHLMTSYIASLAAVLGSQFSSKSFAGGREGVLRLIRKSSGVGFVLEAMGFGHDTLALLQHRGWDALLEARRQARRARLRLPWPGKAGVAGSQGAMSAASSQQQAALQAEAGVAELEAGTLGQGEAGLLEQQQQQQEQQPLEAVVVPDDRGAVAMAAAGAPLDQLVAASPAEQQQEPEQPGQRSTAQQNANMPPQQQQQQQQQQQHVQQGIQPAQLQQNSQAPPQLQQLRALVVQPSAVQRLLRRASTLGSGRRMPPELGPCPSARGPLAIRDAATPLDALVLQVDEGSTQDRG
ncbi:hypothetical protein ABPG75_006336 [Micractinium tetrahymenae]